MIAEFRTAQLRVKPRCIIAEGSGGQIFYATPTRARLLIDSGAAELVNAGPAVRPVAGPSEAPTAGPSEFKEPAEKKSSAVVPAGPSTDFQSSSATGPAAVSQSSAAAQASPLVKPKRSGKRGKRGG